MVENLNRLVDNEAKLLIHTQKEWRENLKVGDYIDAVDRFETPQNVQGVTHIDGWSIGKIIKDSGNTIQVAFMGMPKSYRMSYRFDSEKIAPLNTHTSDFNWRYELKTGDVFDCCDDYGIWYRSTVKDIY